MIRSDLRITFCDFFEGPLPEIAAETLHVRLVSHRHSFTTVGARVLKCGDNDSFHAATSVHFVL